MIVFNKPYGVLCQFTDKTVPARPTLAAYGLPPDVYPAGRLDFDSEGLLLLSDDGARIAQVSSPKFKWPKTYVVQVEGDPDDEQLRALREGRNRQVRRMSAAVGLPTLRLVRIAVGPYHLDGLAPGEWRRAGN